MSFRFQRYPSEVSHNIHNEYSFIALICDDSQDIFTNKRFVGITMFMEKILISACLLGDPVRYDGKSQPVDHPLILKWQAQDRLIAFCPEVEAGLPIPRPPAEILGGTGKDVLEDCARVTTKDADVTLAFIKGAQAALEMVVAQDIKVAILKGKSPSCGSAFIYDGTFTRTLRPGMGVTTALLRKNEVLVFNEKEINSIESCIN